MTQQFQQPKRLDKLYSIQKIKGIIQDNGRRYGIVKWQNFSNRENTKEPIQQLRNIVGLRESLQELEREFDFRDMLKKINKQIKRAIIQELHKKYALPEDKITQEIQHNSVDISRKSIKLSIYEQSKVDVQVNHQILRRARLGLKDLKSEDYFYFMKLRFKVEDQVYRNIRMKNTPKTDEIVDKVNSFYRHQNSFKFCVTIKDIVYSCTIDEMLSLFPINFLNYLNDLTAYLKTHLEKQIKQSDKFQKSRRYKYSAFHTIMSVFNTKQRLQTNANPIYFGLNASQAQKNRQKYQSYLSGKPLDSSSEDDFGSGTSRLIHQDPYSNLQKIYKNAKNKFREMEAQKKRLNKIVHTPQKVKNKKSMKDKLKIQRQLKNLASDSSFQNQSKQKSASYSSSLRRSSRQRHKNYQQNSRNQNSQRNSSNKKLSSRRVSMDEEIYSQQSQINSLQ